MSRRWLVLGLIFLGILVSYVDRGNLSIAATSIMHDFGLEPGSMGVLLSAFFWTYAVCQIPAGYVVDRFGIRLAYAAAFLLWSCASAGIALSRGFGDILPLRMLLGVAETAAPVASLAFIRQNFSGREQGLPVSIYISGQTLGPALGTLLGSMLLASFGWRTLFAVTGLGALFWIPFWLFFAPRRNARSEVQAVHHPGRAWTKLFSSGTFWTMCAAILFLSYYWYFVLTWMPAYLTMTRGFSTTGMGRILSAPLFAMAATNILLGWIADRMVTKSGQVYRVRLAFTAFGLAGASSILLLNYLPDRASILAVLLLSICCFGVASSNYWTIASHTAPSWMVGQTIGILNTMSQLAGVAAPLITGWSLGPQKNFQSAILYAAIAPLLACVLLVAAGPARLDKLKAELNG